MAALFPAGSIHLHITDACNLRCGHCYSDSSPHRDGWLTFDQCVRAIERGAALGYRHLSISGGEPTLAPWLGDLGEAARSLGFSSSVVTNGLVHSERALGALAAFDTVAVSVDGLREHHDELRRRAGSFERATRLVRRLSANGQKVGMVTCVQEHTVADIPALWELASDLGASLYQFRPMAGVGRGRGVESSTVSRIALVAALLAGVETSSVRVQADVVSAELAGSALADVAEQLDAALADVSAAMSPLVIDERGRIRPFSYNIEGFDVEWHDLEAWNQELRARVARLLRSTISVVERSGPFVDVFAAIAEASCQAESAVELRTVRV